MGARLRRWIGKKIMVYICKDNEEKLGDDWMMWAPGPTSHGFVKEGFEGKIEFNTFLMGEK